MPGTILLTMIRDDDRATILDALDEACEAIQEKLDDDANDDYYTVDDRARMRGRILVYERTADRIKRGTQ